MLTMFITCRGGHETDSRNQHRLLQCAEEEVFLKKTQLIFAKEEQEEALISLKEKAVLHIPKEYHHIRHL